jgi:hypothetical protein
VRVAFHFNPNAFCAPYVAPITRLLFQALRSIPPERRHYRIRRGDLLVHKVMDRPADAESLAQRLLSEGIPVWATVSGASLNRILPFTRPYVLAVEGLAPRDATKLDRTLRSKNDGYVGALQIHLANSLHWGLYEASLVPYYRVVGEELRMLHTSLDLDPEGRDDGMFAHWQASGLFRAVAWEDIGVQSTLLDPYQTPQHAARAAELEDILGNQMSSVASELLLRAGSWDPALVETLYAALESFESADSAERLAHTCVSCRRLFVRLADNLFPAQDELIDGRKVGPTEYRNRLWAFIGEKLRGEDRARVVGQLDDVGRRLDRLDALANKGIHSSELDRADVQRFLVGLLTLLYDILTLAPPPTKASIEPFARGIEAFAQGLVDFHKRRQED